MKRYLSFVSLCCAVCGAIATYSGILSDHARPKRELSGALEIVSNHAQPIHEDIKHDNEDGTENVPPPKVASYEGQSLRKSWPLTSKLDLVRSVTRVVTLAVLVLSAAIEFYPLIQHLYYLYYL